MPGESFRGPLPEATPTQASLTGQLRSDVYMLAGTIGERNLGCPDKLKQAEEYLAGSLTRAGYPIHRNTYTCGGQEVSNLEVEIRGLAKPD